MFVRSVKIESETVIKIYEKHSVLSEEIELVLTKDKAIFKKAGGDQYIALGVWGRYITIFFTYDNKTKDAIITTAYPSSLKQIRSYKKLTRGYT